MKKLLILFLLVLTGCVEPFNEEEFIKSLPVTECTNPICKKLDINENTSEGSPHPRMIVNSKYLKKRAEIPNNDYLLDIYYIYDDCGLQYPPKCKITKVDATLKTKEGTIIKNYKIENKSDIKGSCRQDLHAESYREKVYTIRTLEYLRSSLYQQINMDTKIYAEAEKLKNEENKKIDELKKISGENQIYIVNSKDHLKEIILNENDVFYLQSANYYDAYSKYEVGIYAGQNTSEGNLADFKTYPYDSEKVFIYGKNDYVDGEPLEGFYKYVGKYKYITIFNVNKVVYAFEALNISKTYKKYIDIVNEMNRKN